MNAVEAVAMTDAARDGAAADRRLTPNDIDRAFENWRRFARQNNLDLGHPDRSVFICSYLNEFMGDTASVIEAEQALRAALDRKRARAGDQ